MDVLDITNIIEKLRTLLESQKIPVVQMYIFGSAANQTMHEWSDIDVAIICQPFAQTRTQERHLLWNLGQNVSSRIEALSFRPEDFEDKYSTIIQEIKKKGIKV